MHLGAGDREPSLLHAWLDLQNGYIFDVNWGYCTRREMSGPPILDVVYTHAEVLALHWFARRLPYRPALLRTGFATYAPLRAVRA